jgi:hypothetical protein
MPPKKNRTPEEQRVFDAEQAEKTRLRAKIAYAKKSGKDYIRAQGNLVQLAAVRPNPVPPSAAIVAQRKPSQDVPEEESESEGEANDYTENYGAWEEDYNVAKKEAEKAGYFDDDWIDAWYDEREARRTRKATERKAAATAAAAASAAAETANQKKTLSDHANLFKKFRQELNPDVDEGWYDDWKRDNVKGKGFKDTGRIIEVLDKIVAEMFP